MCKSVEASIKPRILFYMCLHALCTKQNEKTKRTKLQRQYTLSLFLSPSQFIEYKYSFIETIVMCVLRLFCRFVFRSHQYFGKRRQSSYAWHAAYTRTGHSTHSEYICFKTEYKFYWLCLLLINTSVCGNQTESSRQRRKERERERKRINDRISIALTSIFRVSGLLFTWRSSAFLSLEFRLLWSQWHYKYVIIPKWIGCYRKKGR